MKIKDLERLYSRFGNMRLDEIIAKKKGNCIYECPKCKGEGTIRSTYNKYPHGLPDSGWVYEEGVKYTDCDLCHNKGYTALEYKPKTKTEIIGYE
ncbi:hypothetical protein [Bacillus cereus group sp. IBL03679]|uniref:hypothetical protein n=1 Tax=Bacillus cereus group sp. IBL03679 TaxID=3240095 RepID=UPI003D2F5ED9